MDRVDGRRFPRVGEHGCRRVFCRGEVLDGGVVPGVAGTVALVGGAVDLPDEAAIESGRLDSQRLWERIALLPSPSMLVRSEN